MSQKFLINSGGHPKELESQTASAGASDAGKIVALDASGRLDQSMMPVGIGADTATLPAFEDLAAGDFINVFNNAGAANIRKADASIYGKEATGFVLAAVTAPANATVYFEGTNTQCSGLTPGALHFLGTTAGQATATAPSGSGNVVQQLGRALSATSMTFEPSQPIELA